MTRKTIPWIVTVAALGAAVVVVFAGGESGFHRHPDARVQEPDLAMTVMPASLAGRDRRVVNAYRIAREMPHTLDGLHCYCECNENFGHRSLLTCFQTRHGAACDICMAEAEMAERLTRQGATVDRIRQAVDATFGT